jgi:hypothetical protein
VTDSEQSGEFASDDRVGEATVGRYIDRRHDLMIARADFTHLFAAYLDHVRRWEQKTDDLGAILMRQGLGAATLHLSCRPRGEIVGWTINIPKPATNIFITGDSARSTVTGRIFTEAVKTSDATRMYVQTNRPRRPLSQSVVEVTGLDVLLMFEQFYAISEQTPARFFEITDLEYLMLLGLPEADDEWLRDLTRDQAVALAADAVLEAVGETTYRFQCGCSTELMMDVVLTPYENDPEELFQGDPGVEVHCPRCGRRWWIERAEFDAAVARRSATTGDEGDTAGDPGVGPDEPAPG